MRDRDRRLRSIPSPAKKQDRVARAGTEIIVDGYRAKNGSNRANGRDLTLPGGKKLFVGSSGIVGDRRGSSGTGAPTDGKDPAEK